MCVGKGCTHDSVGKGGTHDSVGKGCTHDSVGKGCIHDSVVYVRVWITCSTLVCSVCVHIVHVKCAFTTIIM